MHLLRRLASLTAFTSLALLASACDTDPPRSDATVELQGAAARDGELWVAPGAITDVVLASADPELADWELATLDPDVASIGAAARVAASTGQIRARLTATRIGDSTLMIHDEAGALVDEVAVHVRNPDDFRLVASHAGGAYAPGTTLRILRGETVPLAAAYRLDGLPLPGPGAVAIADDPDRLAFLSERADGVAITTPTGGRGEVELTAGPDARVTVEVIAVEATEVTATLVGADPDAAAGELVYLSVALTDAAGRPVLASSLRWLGDSDRWTEAGAFAYTHDPEAPPSEIIFAVGEGASEIRVTTIIQRGR